MKWKFPAPTVALFVFVLTAAPILAADPSTPVEGPKTGKEVLVVKDSENAQTFNADGQDVTVNGSHNKVTIKGTCHALTVSGSSNTVSVAAVASIALSGAGNEVSWISAVGGEKPQITDVGKGNQVSHEQVRVN